MSLPRFSQITNMVLIYLNQMRLRHVVRVMVLIYLNQMRLRHVVRVMVLIFLVKMWL